jgi:hypothetical protein
MGFVAIPHFHQLLPTLQFLATAATFCTQSRDSLHLSQFLLAIYFTSSCSNFPHLSIFSSCLLRDFESSNLEFETSLLNSKQHNNQKQKQLASLQISKQCSNQSNVVSSWISKQSYKQYALLVAQ